MPRKNEPIERTCLVTRETKPVGALMRFVLGPGSIVVPDLKRTLPGRGVWLTGTRSTVETAVKKRLFGRGFGEEAQADPSLPDLIDRLLQDAALGTLGLARKAGSVVVGFAKVEASIIRESLAGVVHAQDAGEDGVNKLAATLRRRYGVEYGLPVVRSFTGTQLDLALGRENVVHAALLAGRASEIFIERHNALDRYRGAAVKNGAASTTAPDRIEGGPVPQDRQAHERYEEHE